ncbi:MAG TPA: MEDS domain-containing protein, partial [Actinomycetota bacterium]|nr:MEDS domain-containing protein [Actinomycetota bacterium]
MSPDIGSLVITALDRSSATPAGPEPSDHFVEFYDEDESLIESVSTFISMGISEGDAAIVVAGPSHMAGIDRALGRSVDLIAARARSLYITLDAEETLALFMKEGRPDPVLFERFMGLTIDR